MAEKSVLIYERDEKFAKPLKLYFRGSAWEPTWADSASQLVPLAEQKRPDAILVSIESDDAESRGLLATLRQEDATSSVPVIVMSSKKDDAELFAGGIASVGAAAYIKKPFIKKPILQLLDDTAAGRAAAAPRPAARGKGGVDLGSVFSEVDQEIDTFFDKAGGPAKGGDEEFSISLEDDAPAAAPAAAPSFASTAEPLAEPAAAREEPHHAEAERREEPATYDAAELRRLRERIRELEEELRQKSEEFKAVAREKERIEHSVGKKESDLIEKIRGLEKHNEDLEEEIKKRKQLVAQMTASVQSLNEDLEEKDRKHAREIEGWQGQLSKLQTQFDELQEKSSNQAHDIEDKTDEIARLNRRIEDLEGERNELQGNLERMTEAKNEGDRAVAGLEGELDSTRQTLGRTTGELETERGRVAAARQLFEERLTLLRTTLQGDMASAREVIDRGLQQARESVDRAAATSEEALRQGLDALLGR